MWLWDRDWVPSGKHLHVQNRKTATVERENKLPIFYKRFVDDTLSAMPDTEAASEFLETLNKSHPSIDFTMEL